MENKYKQEMDLIYERLEDIIEMLIGSDEEEARQEEDYFQTFLDESGKKVV